MNQLYTAACIFDGNIRYFEHLLPDPSTPKVGASSGTRRPVVCLELLRETIKKYLPDGKAKLGLLKDENFLNTLVELSKAHAPGYEIHKEDADDITKLWMEIRLDLIAYFKTLEHNEIVDNFIRSLEHKDNHSFYTHFKRPELESVLTNEGLAKEFHFIAWKCRENDLDHLSKCNRAESATDTTVKRSPSNDTVVYDFITSCNDATHTISMKVYDAKGKLVDFPFKITSETCWFVVRQFADAKSTPVVLKKPKGRKTLNLKSMFRKTKGDNRDSFYNYIYTAKIGSKAAYELRQIPKKRV